MKIVRTIFYLFLGAILTFGCGDDNPTGPSNTTDPLINSINPSAVLTGDLMTISGKNFGLERGSSKVFFNNNPVTNYTSWSDSVIKVVVPTVNSSGVVKVEVNSIMSNAKDYTIDQNPRIFSAGNGRAYIGQDVTIIGANFGNSIGSVEFNGTVVTSIISWTDTNITVVVPNGATSGNLVVKQGSKSSPGFYFTIATKEDPFINMIYPATTSVGAEIKISGRNFGDSQSTSYVDFNGVKATEYSLWNDDSIRVKVPQNATTGPVRVFVASTASNTSNVTITSGAPDPQITSLSKTSFEIDEVITVQGKNFGTDKADNAYVFFNGVKATDYLLWENTMIKVTVPAGTQSGKVVVVIGTQTSNAVDYTIKVANPSPVITGINPTIAQSGQTVSITGNYFGTTSGSGSFVVFGSTQATSIVSWSNTEIIVTVPDIPSGPVDVFVNANGKQSNKISFTVQQKAAVIVECIEVPAGSFLMGNPDPQAGDSYPQHKVNITKPFLVGKYEVTQAQFKKVMNQLNPSRIKDDKNPVEQLTWLSAIDFCNRLSKLEGLTECYTVNGNTITWNKSANGYRLLTEAEWEYACRAGSQGKFGNVGGSEGIINNLGWTNANSPGMKNVGLLNPNDFGIYDMHGNAAEWVWDFYDMYSGNEETDPTGPTESVVEHVFRGGGYIDGPTNCSAWIRYSAQPEVSQYYIGFRVCRNK